VPKSFDAWTVLPHGPVEAVAENLWRVEGSLPEGPIKRVMTAARRADGALVLHNAVAMDEDRMRALEALGRPAWLLVPNGWHRLDARAFKDRYPEARVACPAGARRRVEEVVPVDATYADFPGDDAVTLEHLDGVRAGEGVMRVASADGTTLVFNDLVTNMAHLPGLYGFVYRLLGATGGPRVHGMVRRFLVKDRPAFRAHLERLAALPSLRRIIVSHGAMIAERAGHALAALAARS
jgi:hypothetical protein